MPLFAGRFVRVAFMQYSGLLLLLLHLRCYSSEDPELLHVQQRLWGHRELLFAEPSPACPGQPQERPADQIASGSRSGDENGTSTDLWRAWRLGAEDAMEEALLTSAGVQELAAGGQRP